MLSSPCSLAAAPPMQDLHLLAGGPGLKKIPPTVHPSVNVGLGLTQFPGLQAEPHQAFWLALQILSVQMMSRIGDHGQHWQSATSLVKVQRCGSGGGAGNKLPSSGLRYLRLPEQLAELSRRDPARLLPYCRTLLAGSRRPSRCWPRPPKHSESRSVVPNPHSQLRGLVVQREVVGLIPARSHQSEKSYLHLDGT